MFFMIMGKKARIMDSDSWIDVMEFFSFHVNSSIFSVK